MTGWASAAVPALKSNATSLLETGAISEEQASWIPALKSLTFVLNIPVRPHTHTNPMELNNIKKEFYVDYFRFLEL